MRNKKWIAAALVCGFVLGNSMPAAQAGILDKVLKGRRYRLCCRCYRSGIE